jgi:hypothetical protein
MDVKPGVGLDIGTSFIIAAKEVKGGKVNYTEFRDAFFRLAPSSPVASKLLEKGLHNKKYFKDTDGSYIVVGQDAIEKAIERHTSAKRPLYRGVISPKEKDARRVLKFILKDLLGPPQIEHEKLIYSIPAQPIDQSDEEFDTGYHEDALRNDLREFGYDASPINEAEAICFSELAEDEYTGIALSSGAGMNNICIMSSGEVVSKYSITKSGDWVDRMAAASLNEADSIVQVEKEHGDFLVGEEVPGNPILTAVSLYYTRLIDYICKHLVAQLASSTLPKFSAPIPLIIAGGTSRARGFKEYFGVRLETLLRESNVSIKISEIRYAKDQLRAVSRGCLLACNS